jgi:2-phosphoglycerate kinase
VPGVLTRFNIIHRKASLKTIVENRREQERTPFLRGILISSLLDAGLPFEDAFQLATTLRNRIGDRKNITTEELQRKVCVLLEELGDQDVLDQYRLPSVTPPRILVHNLAGTARAFSRGQHARYLRSAGVKTEKAEYITELIFAELISAGITSITTLELGYITYLCLLQEMGDKAAKRYLVWSEFQNSETPLILLIGGTVATGKSTIATEIAHLLDIVRIQSTDMLREVMRMMIPDRLLPVLHTSSFDAWKKLPLQDRQDSGPDQLVAEGYRSQADLLRVPCEAALQRAIEERVPIIMEGVHVHPDLLKSMRQEPEVITVYVMLAVLKSKKIKSRLRGRGANVPRRKPEKYLDNLDSIWHLQSYLLSEADRCDVPIINSGDREAAILQITQQVNTELAHHFCGAPAEVFGDVVERLNKDDAASRSWHEAVALLNV